MVAVASWGRLGVLEHQVIPLVDQKQIITQLKGSLPGIAYGMGRSYGDVCLNPGGSIWDTKGLDRFVQFDVNTGVIACESGVLLRDIQRLVIPSGWILPVTPGTQMVTVGGAIANDVHGKNHHVCGSFGNHIRKIDLVRTDGTTIVCGPNQNQEWFSATVGGLGLTGIIAYAEIQLRKVSGPWLDTESISYSGLSEFFQLADESESSWEHTVSWIDCMSGKAARGIFMRGNPTSFIEQNIPKDKKRTMPFVPPFSMVNEWTLRPFNSVYFNVKRFRAGREIVHYEPFFYPLDNLLEWNRLYGPRGFYQYQSVVPREAGSDAVAAMLEAITISGEGSFLAVLKTFGKPQSVGMMSFPESGVTLALDFPNRGDSTFKLFNTLDAIVREARGRIYPAKDARMPRDLFEAGYPRLKEFLGYRDPGISSALSRRLMGY